MAFNYKEYFKSITPKTKIDVYNRFLFAFTSIHTTWQSNLKGYLLMKDSYHTKFRPTKELIIKAGLGLNQSRTDSIIRFTEAFQKDWKWFKRRRSETWQEYANRLQNNIYGLGYAKTRFAIELLYPNSAKVICVDTHIAQWGKQNPNKMTKKLYSSVEQGFLNHAKQKHLNPVEARWRWWDVKQGFSNPRYWSFCLEE